MIEILSSIALFSVGYILASILWYMNHRFILHGRVGDFPFLKHFKHLHTLHHVHAYDGQKNKYIVVPWWAHLIIVSVSAPFLFFSFSLWCGAATFPLVYTWRHYSIHNSDTSSVYYRMHAIHHTVNPFVNYSGVHPVVDRIFGTELNIFPLTRP
jgi:hypothetical protein